MMNYGAEVLTTGEAVPRVWGHGTCRRAREKLGGGEGGGEAVVCLR